MQITEQVRTVLAQAEVGGDGLRLAGQLDRKLYVEVNKVLEAIGGKWNRKLGAHVFPEPVEPMLEDILLTGEYRRVKQDLGQFDTPVDLAAYVAALLDIYPGMLVLEPSIGIGRLAKEAKVLGGVVSGYEIDQKRAESLLDEYDVGTCDFLTVTPEAKYHRVLMNPPFAGQADIDHVTHAMKFLLPGGKLVAIMSAAVAFRTNAKTEAFRALVEANHGDINGLPAGSFKVSGTDVNTVIVTMRRAS